MDSRSAQPSKKSLVKLCRKSLALPEFGQLQSDLSISNLMMSHGFIKGFTAHCNYFWQFEC